MNNGADMNDFGHFSSVIAGATIDYWGAGPFIIEVAGKRHHFTDSDRFGPLRESECGRVLDTQWGEKHLFWKAYAAWQKQGRQIDAATKICIWTPLKPTILQRKGKIITVLVHGDEDGGDIWESGEDVIYL